MTQARLNRLLGQLQQAGVRPPSDAELLGQFIDRRAEDAFAALLRRHGPMVLGVCRRILGNAHDAEDAFQAVFLVLVRKAGSIRPREAVGNWLYGVAYRTALEARARLARRRRREKQVPDLPPVESRPVGDPWEELRPLLDREVHRLPDIYRLAIILCDLEGRSRKAAAEQLGVPEGTLSSRLAAGRKRLARRLSRHGPTLTAGALVVLLGKNAAASVPAALGTSTTRAALLVAAGQTAAVSGAVAALTEGVLKTMFLAKVKTVTVVLLGVTVLGLGTGKMYYAAGPGQQGPVAAARDRGKPVADGRTQQGQQASHDEVEDARLKALAARQEVAAAEAKVQEAQRVRAFAGEKQVEQERALRAELARLREEVATQRDRAEAALQEAQQQRRQAEAQLEEARLQLERARRAEAEARQQGQGAGTVGQPLQGGRLLRVPRVPESPLENLRATAQKVRADFLLRREQLQVRLKKLEAERENIQAQLEELEQQQQRALESLRQKEAEIARDHEIRPDQRKAPQPAAGDRLDRILEKLEQLERRLERLERSGQQTK